MSYIVTNIFVFFVPWGVSNFVLYEGVTTRRVALVVIAITVLLTISNLKISLRLNPVLFLQILLLIFTIYPIFYLNEVSLFLSMILGGLIFNLLLLVQSRYFVLNKLNISFFAVSLFSLSCIAFYPVVFILFNNGVADIRSDLLGQISVNSFGNYNFCIIFSSIFTLRYCSLAPYNRLLLYFAVLISLLCIAVTLSRQNALLVFVLFFLINFHGSFFIGSIRFLITTIGFFVSYSNDFLPVFLLQLLNRFSRIVDGGDGSQSQRIDQIYKIFEVLDDHPFGVGVGYFFTYATDRTLIVTESSYLDFFVGMGIFSVFFFALLSLLLFSIYRISNYKFMVGSFITCFLLASIFNEMLHEPMFWIMLLSIYILGKKHFIASRL